MSMYSVLKLELDFKDKLSDDEKLFIEDCVDNQLSQIYKMLETRYFPTCQVIDFVDLDRVDNE